MNKDQAGGIAKNMAGNVQQAAGQLTVNPAQVAKGQEKPRDSQSS